MNTPMAVLKKVLQQLFSSKRFSTTQAIVTEETGNFTCDNNFDFDNVPACPDCASNNVASFVYGKPQLDKIIIAGLESGKIISGGCMIRKTAPKWHCYNCNKDFGQLR